MRTKMGLLPPYIRYKIYLYQISCLEGTRFVKFGLNFHIAETCSILAEGRIKTKQQQKSALNYVNKNVLKGHLKNQLAAIKRSMPY